MGLSVRALEVLAWLAEDGDDEDGYEREITLDGGCWIGLTEIKHSTLHALINCCAVSALDVGLKTGRYAINETGRAILRKPDLADQVTVCVMGQKPFSIVDDRIVFQMTPTPSASQTASADAGEGEASHTPKCWGRTSYLDEMTHCYCAKPNEADALAALLDNLVIAQSLSKELREQALNQAQSYLYDRRKRLAALRQTSSEPLPDIEAEGERIVRETYKPEDGGYLWTDVVGAVQTAIAEERARHSAPTAPEHAASERVRVLEEFGQHRNLELSYSYGDEDGQGEGWCVHSVNGGRNDREWTLLATAETPVEAILASLASRPEGDRGLVEKLVGYAVHDDDCTVNRYPGHDACSCGLSAILQQVRHSPPSGEGG